MSITRLSCSVQNYAWGKLGSGSVVAQLSTNSCNPSLVVDESQPYAELWMGTHPNGQSAIFDDPATSLASKLSETPEKYLGRGIVTKYRGDLPFLFKVLSVGKALSIQAHPDAGLAESLHRSAPTIYKDGNHKPEMCIALTEFEGLCGFRLLDEITGHLEKFPELRELAAVSKVSDSAELKLLFANMMRAKDDRVKPLLKTLVDRLKHQSASASYKNGSIEELILRLNQQYPGDVGCFCALLLNYVILKPGEAMFLAANEPHAYLSGDCIECMATSDNVVRAGLTPKLKDVETLVNMLSYKSYSRDQVLMKPVAYGVGNHSRLFKSPVNEFSLIETAIEGNDTTIVMPAIDGPSILIAIEGAGELRHMDQVQMFSPGSVYFVTPKTEFTIASKMAMKCYRAFCVE